MSEQIIQVEINGNEVLIPENSNIAKAAEIMGIPLNNIVAELDGEIIPKSDFEKTILKQGVKLELVRFVGGG